MDEVVVREEVGRHFWWHSIDLGAGIVTPGRKTVEDQRLEADVFFGPIDLTGKSVIDIGAWNGAYSFDARKRGATRVLAVDESTWLDPRFKGKDAFDFANTVLGAEVESRIVDISKPLPSDIGQFDVVLFAGVFYHLRNPIAGLQNAAALAKELLIVETYIDIRDYPRPAMVFYPTDELAGDATNWWGPNEACVLALLKDLGFSHIDASLTFGNRGTFHAWRSTEARLRGPLPGCELKHGT